MTKSNPAGAFFRELGMVEAQQTAAEYSIPSELKTPTPVQVGFSVIAA